jgi:hypothetical protein
MRRLAEARAEEMEDGKEELERIGQATNDYMDRVEQLECNSRV